MRLNSDFKDLLLALSAHEVRYLIVGGYAVGFHVEPRFTKDLDVWISPDGDNPERVIRALRDFGAPLEGVTADDFAKTGTVFQLGMAPNRVDILNELSGGIDFDAAWAHRVEGSFGGVAASFIGVEELLKNKLAAARPQDIRDARALQRLQSAKKPPSST